MSRTSPYRSVSSKTVVLRGIAVAIMVLSRATTNVDRARPNVRTYRGRPDLYCDGLSGQSAEDVVAVEFVRSNVCRLSKSYCGSGGAPALRGVTSYCFAFGFSFGTTVDSMTSALFCVVSSVLILDDSGISFLASLAFDHGKLIVPSSIATAH